MKNKTYYYQDELSDEFSGITRNKINIDQNYKYMHSSWLWNFSAWITYHLLVLPYDFVYMKLYHHLKIVNRQCFKQCKKQGYYLYANHTNVPSDGFLPALLTFPKRDYVVVSSENLAIKGTRNIMQMIGAIPVPSFKGMRNFINTMKTRINQNYAICIYPEAHIWPYYTKIRNFKSDSFRYPCLCFCPSYCFTVTYQKRKHSTKPKMTVYCDGPFYVNNELNEVDQREDLRNRIYNTMVERSKNSTYSYNTYIKKEKEK